MTGLDRRGAVVLAGFAVAVVVVALVAGPRWLPWDTLSTLVTAFLGGIVGALASDFVRVPFRQFFNLRAEIRSEMLRLANVSALDLTRNLEAQETLRRLGARMMAFGETETVVVKIVRWRGYDPKEAGSGLIGFSNTFSERGSERAAHRGRIN